MFVFLPQSYRFHRRCRRRLLHPAYLLGWTQNQTKKSYSQVPFNRLKCKTCTACMKDFRNFTGFKKFTTINCSVLAHFTHSRRPLLAKSWQNVKARAMHVCMPLHDRPSHASMLLGRPPLPIFLPAGKCVSQYLTRVVPYRIKHSGFTMSHPWVLTSPKRLLLFKDHKRYYFYLCLIPIKEL